MNERHHLATTELTGDALDRVAGEAWRRLEAAADNPMDPLRILTLCTVTPEGTAAGRLMLLRGAEPGAQRLWCHTTRHSGKVVDLRHNPSFAAVAYEPVDRIQLRITGTSRIHEIDSTTVRHFEQALVSRRCGQVPDNAIPDPVWPFAVELLLDRAKRDSWEEFVVIELNVESIDWTQVAEKSVRRA